MPTITEYLADEGLTFEALRHRRVTTGIEEADALGMRPEVIAKTIVLDTSKGHILAVIPASRKLDLKLAKEALHDSHVCLAPESEVQRDFPGFELGAMPPFDPFHHVPTVLDVSLTREPSLVFADGWQTESVRMRTGDLVRASRARIANLTEPHTSFDESWAE